MHSDVPDPNRTLVALQVPDETFAVMVAEITLPGGAEVLATPSSVAFPIVIAADAAAGQAATANAVTMTPTRARARRTGCSTKSANISRMISLLEMSRHHPHWVNGAERFPQGTDSCNRARGAYPPHHDLPSSGPTATTEASCDAARLIARRRLGRAFASRAREVRDARAARQTTRVYLSAMARRSS